MINNPKLLVAAVGHEETWEEKRAPKWLSGSMSALSGSWQGEKPRPSPVKAFICCRMWGISSWPSIYISHQESLAAVRSCLSDIYLFPVYFVCMCPCLPHPFLPMSVSQISSRPPVCLLLLPPPPRCVSSLSLGSRGWAFFMPSLASSFFSPSTQWGLQPVLLLLRDEEAVAKRQWNVSTWPSRKRGEEGGGGGWEGTRRWGKTWLKWQPTHTYTHTQQQLQFSKGLKFCYYFLPFLGSDEETKGRQAHCGSGKVTVMKKNS